MSMNLEFIDENCNPVDFPYQTSTRVTYAVFNTKTRSGKMKIIRRDLSMRGKRKKQIDRWGKEKYREAKAMLRNKSLRLVMS